MAKVIHLRKDETIEQLHKKLQRAQKNLKGINTGKYSGSIAINEDPIAYQKKMRNEWN